MRAEKRHGDTRASLNEMLKNNNGVVTAKATMAPSNMPSPNSARLTVPPQSHQTQLGDENAVRACAKTLTGLSDIEAVAQTRLDYCTIPFLSSFVIGQPLWKISFAPIDLTEIVKEHPKSNDVSKKVLRRFELLINNSGQFILIRDLVKKRRDPIKLGLNLVQLENRMRPMRELYLWLPSDKPNLSFMDALCRIKIGNPNDAAEIEGHFVMLMNSHSPRGGNPLQARPAWAISLRATPPIRGRTELRHVIDDTTGRFFYANSIL